jgi:hypothetical protein
MATVELHELLGNFVSGQVGIGRDGMKEQQHEGAGTSCSGNGGGSRGRSAEQILGAGCEEWMRFGIGGERGADSVERWAGFAALAPATLVGCQTVVLPRLVQLASVSRASSNSLVIVTSKISCSAH